MSTVRTVIFARSKGSQQSAPEANDTAMVGLLKERREGSGRRLTYCPIALSSLQEAAASEGP